MLDAARELGPTIRAEADRIEAERQLPEDLVVALTGAGVFQMFLPRSVGGPEVHPLTGMAVVEELTRADGSVGWCTQVAAATTMFLAWLDPDAVHEMVATTTGPIHIAGSARPLGTAVRTEGGYRVTGRWNFASGVRHANWFLASAFVDGSSPRSMLVPIEAGEIMANWDVLGMRGDRQRRLRPRRCRRAAGPHRGPALGRAADRAALRPGPQHGGHLGPHRGDRPRPGPGGHRRPGRPRRPGLGRVGHAPAGPAPVQQAVGECEAIASAARAFCVEAIEELWEARLAGCGGPALARPVARAQLAITHSLNEAVRVADRCFHAAGTNAASAANRLERFLRDAHTAVLHAAGQPIHREVAGAGPARPRARRPRPGPGRSDHPAPLTSAPPTPTIARPARPPIAPGEPVGFRWISGGQTEPIWGQGKKPGG